MKNLRITGTLLVLLAGFNQKVNAQKVEERPHEVSILLGTIQPFMLSGWNVEVDYTLPGLVVNYSHGWSLELRDNTVVGDAKEQHLSLHLPYSTGFGIGYRFTEYFNARLEGKVHRFQVYYEDELYNRDNLVVDYTTTTLGLGVYYTYKPFKKRENFLKGISTSTSVRYWHRIYSTLEDNMFSYHNRITEKQEIHKAAEIGIANTPWIFNISVGYSFEVGRANRRKE